ncbi:MAG: hypothetical protein V1859_11425 [archaeon]
MSSDNFLKVAEKIAKEDKPFFDSLIEFEKTGKIRTKDRVNFTIDKSLMEKFRKYCKENGYNMSAKIEKAIEQIISR